MSLSLELIHPPSSGLCPCQEKPRSWAEKQWKSRAESNSFELCQGASCFAETEKQFFNDNVNLNDNLNFLGLSIIEVEQKERFFLSQTRVFLFEVCNNDSYVVRGIPLAWELALKDKDIALNTKFQRNYKTQKGYFSVFVKKHSVLSVISVWLN